MPRTRFFLLVFPLLLILPIVWAEDSIALPVKENFHLYLLRRIRSLIAAVLVFAIDAAIITR